MLETQFVHDGDGDVTNLELANVMNLKLPTVKF